MKHINNTRSLRSTIFAVYIMGMTLATAQSLAADAKPAKNQAALEAIKNNLQKSFDDVTIEKILPSAAWPGLYEVVTPTELAYTNADGTLLFAGKIIDAATKADLTARRWGQLNRIDVNELPLDNAIKIVKGDGSRKLYLFSDPDCPYCQALEKEMKDVTNVTIYTFLYPLESLHPQARDKANNIWCATDRAKVWTDWMQTKTLAFSSCEQQVVADNLKLGARLKVNATPTLFFADGHRIDGTLSKEQLEAELAAK